MKKANIRIMIVVLVVAIVGSLSITRMGYSRSPKDVDKIGAVQVHKIELKETEIAPKVRTVPLKLNYQGYLTDNNGIPINGTKQMIFKIYTAVSGGTSLWVSGNQPVDVDSGIFHYILNDVPLSVFSDGQSKWLELTVQSEILSPRTEITSSAWAYFATYADSAGTAGADNDWIISGSDMYSGVSGNVGIGVTSPSYPLHVEKSVSGFATAYFKNTVPSIWGVGVYGECANTDEEGWGGYFKGGEYGVYGDVTPTGDGYYTGVEGSVHGGIAGCNLEGVSGFARSPGINEGVHGWADSGELNRGVCGAARDGNNNNYGVYGYAMGGPSYSGTQFGIYGSAMWGTAAPNYGVYGKGTDGSVHYGVYYEGGISGSDKNSLIVRTSEGPTEMYTLESTEMWFEDIGSGKLINGRCPIELETHFLETVNVDDSNPMKVFVQIRDDCKGVYVRIGDTGFDVIELQDGTSNAIFDYRILAKRKGYETQRMDIVESSYTDRFLYPTDDDPSIPYIWRERRKAEKKAEKEFQLKLERRSAR